jgi:hypothetical protein
MSTFFTSSVLSYLPSPLKHLFACHFENPCEKQNIIATFQSDQLTDDLDRFNLNANGTKWRHEKWMENIAGINLVVSQFEMHQISSGIKRSGKK